MPLFQVILSKAIADESKSSGQRYEIIETYRIECTDETTAANTAGNDAEAKDLYYSVEEITCEQKTQHEEEIELYLLELESE